MSARVVPVVVMQPDYVPNPSDRTFMKIAKKGLFEGYITKDEKYVVTIYIPPKGRILQPNELA